MRCNLQSRGTGGGRAGFLTTKKVAGGRVETARDGIYTAPDSVLTLMRRGRGSATGFTLIELLVVITIVAILAAILFPVFAAAKNAAKAIVCISNMRQISFASQLYLGDYDDRYFPAAYAEAMPGFAPQVTWIGFDNNNTGTVQVGFYGDVSKPAAFPPRPGLLDPYLKDEGVKRCPKQSPLVQLAVAINDFDPNIPSDYYVVNPQAQGNEFGPCSMASNFLGSTYQAVGAPAAMLEEPAETLLAWEHLAVAPACNWLQRSDWFSSPPNDQLMKGHFNLLHNGGTTTIWCDGHVKRMSYERLKRPMFSVRKDIYPVG